MFDIGWGEMFLIGVVALIVVGPKDLPALFRTAGNFMGKARGMAREFQRSMEQAANEAGVSEMTESLKALDRNLNAATGTARGFAQTIANPTMANVGKTAASVASAAAGPEKTPPAAEAAAVRASETMEPPHKVALDTVAPQTVAPDAAPGDKTSSSKSGSDSAV